MPEIAGDAALLFDPRSPEALANALVALIGDQALRARLIEAGRRRAAQFTDTARMIEEYWRLFVSVAGDARG